MDKRDRIAHSAFVDYFLQAKRKGIPNEEIGYCSRYSEVNGRLSLAFYRRLESIRDRIKAEGYSCTKWMEFVVPSHDYDSYSGYGINPLKLSARLDIRPLKYCYLHDYLVNAVTLHDLQVLHPFLGADLLGDCLRHLKC